MENEQPEETAEENVQSQPEEIVEPIKSPEIEEPIKTEDAVPEAPIEEAKVADVVEDVKVAEVVQEPVQSVNEPVQETEPEVVQEIVQTDVQEAVQDAVEDIVEAISQENRDIVEDIVETEAQEKETETAEVIESKEIEPVAVVADEPIKTSNEEDEILDQLEKSILDEDSTHEPDEVKLEVSAHHTDNEEVDMDIVATGEQDNAIIAEQGKFYSDISFSRMISNSPYRYKS